MNRTEKTELASALKDKFSKAKVAIFSDYKGLTANQANDLRKQLRAQNAEAKVIKNNVARLLVKESFLGTGATVVDNNVGPTLVTFAYGDPAAAAKVLHKFAQDNEAFNLKNGILGDQAIDMAGVEELAKLPSREVLLAKVLGSMNAPISNFVGVLAAVPRSLVTVLSAIEKKKAEGTGATN